MHNGQIPERIVFFISIHWRIWMHDISGLNSRLSVVMNAMLTGQSLFAYHHLHKSLHWCWKSLVAFWRAYLRIFHSLIIMWRNRSYHRDSINLLNQTLLSVTHIIRCCFLIGSSWDVCCSSSHALHFLATIHRKRPLSSEYWYNQIHVTAYFLTLAFMFTILTKVTCKWGIQQREIHLKGTVHPKRQILSSSRYLKKVCNQAVLWHQNTALFPTFFRISSFVFRTNTFIQVWVNCLFKEVLDCLNLYSTVHSRG